MNNPIRILQIGMHDKIGGVETFLMNYYNNIDKQLVQFDFLNPYEHLCFEDQIIKNGGRIYNIPNFKKRPIKYYLELKKIIKNNKYNIVHINMLSSANILPILAAKMNKVSHIIAHSHNSNTPSGVIKKFLNKVNRSIVRNLCTDYFGCSELAGNWLFGEDFLKNNNLVIINNAIESEKFVYNETIRKTIRKHLNIEDKFVVGHVGRFSYQKNHEFLIKIFNEIQKIRKDAILLLIGQGELQHKVEEEVKRLGINDKVIFLGITDKVNEYLQAMDIFLLPSRFEGLPVIGIEAQMSGIQCFFSDTITKEVDISGNVLFINLNNTPEFLAKQIIENNIQFKRLKNIKMQKYDIKNEAKKLQNMYIGFNRG